MSEETTCYSATLYLDGKRVGYVKNDGRGGCDHIQLIGNDQKVWEALREAVSEIPDRKSTISDMMLKPDMDTLMHMMPVYGEVLKKVKRDCKTKVVFRDATCTGGEYFAIKAPYTPEIEAKIRERYESTEPVMEVANGNIEAFVEILIEQGN